MRKVLVGCADDGNLIVVGILAGPTDEAIAREALAELGIEDATAVPLTSLVGLHREALRSLGGARSA